jgi:hypothetical protein
VIKEDHMTDVSALVQEGIAAAKSGQRAQARDLLMRAVGLDDHNEQAWLWLSGVTEEIEDQIICLENVLVINPASAAAGRGLRQLRAKLPPPPSTPVAVEAPAEPEDDIVWEESPAAQAEAKWTIETDDSAESPGVTTRTCVSCGTVNQGEHMICSYCGRALYEKSVPASAGAPTVPGTLEADEPDHVRFVSDYDSRPQGLMSLFASWIAALSFNRRGAYEHEIFSASAGRTVGGIVLGGVILPLLIVLISGIVLASSTSPNWLAILPTVAATPFVVIPAIFGLIIHFYLWTGGLYLVAWAMGGKASFSVHAQLLSIAYAASSLLGSFAFLVGGAVLAALIEPPNPGSPLGTGIIWLAGLAGLSLIVAVYTLAMHGQALSVAHRFSWLGGIGVLLVSALVYVLLIVLAALVVLLISNRTLTDLALLTSF